jgi:hypothetical protein
MAAVPESFVCGQCGARWTAPVSDAVSGAADTAHTTECPRCFSNQVRPFDPHAAPLVHQPNPELLHLQHLTPRPPLAPGAMVAMGPYMPLPRPTSLPARWGEDPTGRNQWRWWSGFGWTDVVANDDAIGKDPLT